MRPLHVDDSFVQNGQVSQAKEVHLQQADRFDRWTVPLCNDVFFASDPLQRNHCIQRQISNHNAGRVRSTVSREAFQAHGEIQQLRDLLVAFVSLLEIRALFNRVLQLDAQCLGNHLRDFVHTRQRNIQRAADVADGGFGFQRSVGSDLRDVFLAVFFFRVVDHHLPTVSTEVDIDIGRFVSAWVEEPFEQQVVLQRAHVTHTQQERNQRTTRRTSSTTRDLVFLREPNKVPHNQEVTGVAFFFDDRQFVVQPLLMVISDVVVAKNELFVANLAQVVDVLLAFGRTKHRVQLAFFQLNIDPIRNLLRTGDGIRHVGERGVHFVGGANVKFPAVHLHAVRIVTGSPGTHAQQDVLHVGVVFAQIVCVVGGDQRQTHLVRKIDSLFKSQPLDLNAGVLDLHVEPISERL